MKKICKLIKEFKYIIIIFLLLIIAIFSTDFLCNEYKYLIMGILLLLIFVFIFKYIFTSVDIKLSAEIFNKKFILDFKKLNNNIFLSALIIFTTILIAYKTIPAILINKNQDYLIQDATYNFTNANIFNGVAIFPNPTSIVDINIDTLNQDLPTTKDQGNLDVNLSMNIDGVLLKTFGTIKVQGTSTLIWPKKNWSLKFYSDQERTKKLLIKIGDSVASDKWIAKAEWIDPTLLRNHLSFKLWESITESRNVFPKYEVDNSWYKSDDFYTQNNTSAVGFPKTHPVQIKINEDHYGLSLLLLGHEPRNFNIDSNNLNHMYFEFDARYGDDLTKTWSKFSDKSIGVWIDSYWPENDEITNNQKQAISDLGKFINGNQTNFNKNFDKYLDKTNMIDMLLFLEVIYDWDAVAQDLEMVTYDLNKWYFLPWDKDTTFGMFYNGEGIMENSEKKLLINYKEEDPTQKPWFKTYHAFKPDVEKRYSQLRKEKIFSIENIYNLSGEVTQKVPKEIWEAEKTRWSDEGRPSQDELSLSQILTWFEARLEILDKHFNYK